MKKLLLIALCSGCSTVSEPVRVQYSVSVMPDDLHVIPPSLGATADQFFRAPTTGVAQSAPPAPGAIGGSLIDIDEDTLSSGSGVTYYRVEGSKLGAKVALDRPLTRNMSAVVSVMASRGHSRYFLPDGAGVLVDPTQISFATTGLELGAGFAFHAGNRVRSRVEIGGGKTFTRTLTEIRSNLLDVTNISSNDSEFVYTSIEVGFAPEAPHGPEFRVRTEAKYYPDIGGSVQTGIVFAY